MRYIAGAAAVVLAALAPAASAAVVTDTVPVAVAFPQFMQPFQVAVPRFDASLGTLTGESLTLAGSFTPGFDWDYGPPGPLPDSVPAVLTANIGLFHGQFITLPGEDVLAIRSGATYSAQGTPEAFSLTNAVPSLYLNDPSFDVWAYTLATPTHIAGGGGLVSVDAISGTLSVTYSYTPADAVPEPPTFALLGLGVLGLMVGRRRPIAP